MKRTMMNYFPHLIEKLQCEGLETFAEGDTPGGYCRMFKLQKPSPRGMGFIKIFYSYSGGRVAGSTVIEITDKDAKKFFDEHALPNKHFVATKIP